MIIGDYIAEVLLREQETGLAVDEPVVEVNHRISVHAEKQTYDQAWSRRLSVSGTPIALSISGLPEPARRNDKDLWTGQEVGLCFIQNVSAGDVLLQVNNGGDTLVSMALHTGMFTYWSTPAGHLWGQHATDMLLMGLTEPQPGDVRLVLATRATGG